MERYNRERLLLIKQRRFELIMLMVFGHNNNNNHHHHHHHHRRRRRRLIRKLPRLREFEQMLFNRILTEHLTLFNCPKCRMILTSPITLECGHTFCNDCLNFNKNLINCWICDATTIITNTNHHNNDNGTNICINVLVQDLVEKWRQQQKTGSNLMVNKINVLRIQPRYHLRSGFAGLQLNDITNVLTPCNLLKTINYDSRLIEEKPVINGQDLECILCSRFLLDPVTTTCGHTFCRDCLIRVLDHGLSCPLCMATLTTKDYSRGTTFIIDQASKYLFIDEYKNRLNLHYKDIEVLNRNSELPVFVCTNAFPNVACPLYVYEPRYRLLVRRCLLSSSRRFAMAAKETHDSGKFVCSGTILEVRDAVSLEDGSFILTTVGVRRFKVISKDEQDGYDTAKFQFIKDSPVSTEKLPDLIGLHQKVYNKASKWILSLTLKVLAEVERLIGPMPKVERNWLNLPDGPAWTWWLMPILPLSSQLQLGFLNSTCLEKRLRAIDKMLDRMEIRMRALERNPVNCSSQQEHSNESCRDPNRTFQMSFTTN